MSGMTALWSSFGLGTRDSASKSEKAKVALEADLKYLYSAFTKIPCLRLAPDHRAPLIRGYEEFPFDTAVPLHSFKNLGALEIVDIDFRSFFGWDRLSEQLRSLTLKRANLGDPADLLTSIVLDDIDRRRRRSSKNQQSPVLGGSGNVFAQPVHKPELSGSLSAPGSPVATATFGSVPQSTPMLRVESEGAKVRTRTGSISPSRPIGSKHSSYRHSRGATSRMRRTGSGSSNSSETSGGNRNSSSPNLLAGFLPPTKWRFLRHLCMADNSLTTLSASGLAPVANTLHSLDLSTNLFTEVPDSLSSLIALRSLVLSNCMIESLHSLSRNPLPAITALNLRGNRLRSLAGIERLLSLERLDLRDNKLSDPTELARLTGLPEIREIWVSGNPFVKTHSGYRVTIFNLFRRTPGYSEDILINGTGPGYTEKKQLVERAAEPEGVPIMRPAATADAEIVHKPSNTATPGVPAAKPGEGNEERREVPAGGIGIGSTRRAKAHRRRIIDLSLEKPAAEGNVKPGAALANVFAVQQVQLPVDPFVSDSARKLGGAQDRTGSAHFGGGLDGNPKSSTLQPRDTTMVQASAPGKDWDAEGELCRQKLEALRQEVGSGWLTVLGDHTWDNTPRDISIHHHAGINIDNPGRIPLSRTSSQAIVSGARTMG